MTEALLLALKNARDAASGRRWSEACGAVLAAWRLCYDPELIGVMDDIYARANQPGLAEQDSAWTALASTADPLDVAALCAAPSSNFMVVAMTRARRLLERPADPRIARWAAQQMDQHYQSALAGVWLDLLEKHGDAHIEATLRPVYGRPGTTPAIPDALGDLRLIRSRLRERDGRAVPEREAPVELMPVSDSEFAVPGRYPLTLRFERDRVVINPGRWQQVGVRTRR
jgi:hypothetical protein